MENTGKYLTAPIPPTFTCNNKTVQKGLRLKSCLAVLVSVKQCVVKGKQMLKPQRQRLLVVPSSEGWKLYRAINTRTSVDTDYCSEIRTGRN